MRPYQRAVHLRRQIAYLRALIGADEKLSAQSDRLQAWRDELEVQGYLAGDAEAMLGIEESELKKFGGAPDELLAALESKLPEAEQLEGEHRIEVVRNAVTERFWHLAMALAWIRFRSVEEACRFLERRDATISLWRGRDVVETNELEQRLASGEVIGLGVRGGVLHEISSAEWTRDGRRGVMIAMRCGAICAARPGEADGYTELRFARQQLQHAFPPPDKPAGSYGPALAAARKFLSQCEGRVSWDRVWSEATKVSGATVSKNARKDFQKELRKDFTDKILRGAPKKAKSPRQ